MENKDIWLNLITETMSTGLISCPRGLEIRELINKTIVLNPFDPFLSFKHRNLNVDYIKKEILWKLGADPMDDSITKHASIWKNTQNSDGSFNSNYGQYWFGKQMGFYKAFNELIADKDSRRAVIPMMNDNHIGPGVNDTVCTEAITFLIRQNDLHMIVHMRSSDQIFGLGIDIPTFSFLYRLMFTALSMMYQDLYVGNLQITAASSHIYERHYDMIKNIQADPTFDKTPIMPFPDLDEAFKLIACKGKVNPDWGALSKWLVS